MVEKIFAIGVISLFTLAFIGMALDDYQENKSNIEFAKQGLEQCPKTIDSRNTIWVKDCTKYLEKISKLEE